MLEETCGEDGGRGSGQVQGGGQQKRCLQRQRLFIGMVACTKKQEVLNTKVVRRLLGEKLRLVERL